jgi:hypothetical protein
MCVWHVHVHVSKCHTHTHTYYISVLLCKSPHLPVGQHGERGRAGAGCLEGFAARKVGYGKYGLLSVVVGEVDGDNPFAICVLMATNNEA